MQSLSFFVFGVRVGRDKQRFLLRIINFAERCARGLFYEFSQRVVYGDFISRFGVAVIRAYLSGEKQNVVRYFFAFSADYDMARMVVFCV